MDVDVDVDVNQWCGTARMWMCKWNGMERKYMMLMRLSSARVILEVGKWVAGANTFSV